MRPRCEQLARVLKGTGSFYYHCDWHASHYVKVMLDQFLGEENFVNEIIWKRQSSHNDAKQDSKHLGRVHDTILLYGEGKGTLGSVWDDIGPVQGMGDESLGYPTQKPLKLLERIIKISSRPN